MTLANIKTQLSSVLDGISNIDTDHVFVDEPDTSPTDEQMPCILVTLPRISPSMPVMGLAKAIYHFNIMYLYAPIDQAQPTKAAAAMDTYLSNVWTALFGALMLSGNANNQDFDGDVIRPTVTFRGINYWGISIPWMVLEQVAVTVTP
jgi:hypothetical protein